MTETIITSLLNEVKMTYTTEEIQELYNGFSAEEKEQLELAVQIRNERKGIAENKDPLTELIDYSEDYGIELTANPFDVFLGIITG